MTTNDSADDGWAIVLDHEHIMFVGTYRQCEDWLDLHEVTNVNGQTRGLQPAPPGHATSGALKSDGWPLPSQADDARTGLLSESVPVFQQTRGWRDSLRALFQTNTGGRRRSVPKQVVDLLRSSDGRWAALETIAMAFVFSLLFLGVWQTSSMIAWKRSMLSRDPARMPRMTRETMNRPDGSSTSSEIVCELAPSFD